MDLTILILIVITHYIGDFPLQQIGNQASKKSHSIRWLTIHALFYTLAFTLFGAITGTAVVWVLFNGAAHWVVDFVTSKITSGLYKSNRIRLFWVAIGFDQMIHYLILFISYALIVT